MEAANQQLICFTIGHSNQSIDSFLQLLKIHKINCIIDIRSIPYSQNNPQFNKENLKSELRNNSIFYILMSDSLGAKYNNPELLFPDGKVDFRKVRQTENFKVGIKRIIEGIKKGYSIALMCSEKDPFNCHRFVLVSYQLSKEGVSVKHICGDGSIALNSELEKKILSEYVSNYLTATLLESAMTLEDALELGYAKRNIDIAFTKQAKEEASI